METKSFKEKFGTAIEVLEIINKAGFESYFVGGCVRDYILNKNFSDIDITTNALPEEIKKILTKRSVGLLEAISSSNINHKKLDELVDEISKKFTENIKNLSFEDKIFKDINKKVESEEKIKSQSLKNSYSETKKYIDNIVNLSLSVQQENPKVYSKKEQKNGVK